MTEPWHNGASASTADARAGNAASRTETRQPISPHRVASTTEQLAGEAAQPAGTRSNVPANDSDRAAASGASGASQPAERLNATALLPAVTLPKGGGAIGALGEKLSVDAATGTASMTVHCR